MIFSVAMYINSVSPARAQAGSPSGPGGPSNWQVVGSPILNGTTSEIIDGYSYGISWSSPGGSSVVTAGDAVTIYAGIGSMAFTNNASETVAGNADITFKWVGQGPAPEYFSAKVTVDAGWGVVSDFPDGSLTIPTAAADDGFADKMVEKGPQTAAIGQEGDSQGIHLMKVEVQNGEATVDLPECSAADGASFSSGTASPYENARIFAVTTFQVQYDPRQLFIHSSVSPTFHKGANGVQVLNVPSPDGTLSDDTVQPITVPGAFDLLTELIPDLSATYSGLPAGPWASNSIYNWSSSLKSDSAMGLFNPDQIQDLSEVYDYTDFPSTGKSSDDKTDQVLLKATDSLDLAKATAIYYLTFHQPFENWHATNTVAHPLPSATSITFAECAQAATATGTVFHLGDWSVDGPFNNPNSFAMPQVISPTVTYSQSAADTGSIALNSSLGLTADLINLGFELNEGFSTTSTTEITYAFPAVTLTIPPHTSEFYLWAKGFSVTNGLTDYYDVHGFEGILPWYMNVYQTLPGGAGVYIPLVISQPLP